MLVNLSTRKWRNDLDFPFSSSQDARVRLFDLQQERDHLKQLARRLVDEWRLNFPATSVPVYLTRVSDKSLTTLRWRRSRMHDKSAAQISFNETLLDYFPARQHKRLVMKYESLRIDLNYKLSNVLYQIERTEQYLQDIAMLLSIRQQDEGSKKIQKKQCQSGGV